MYSRDFQVGYIIHFLFSTTVVLLWQGGLLTIGIWVFSQEGLPVWKYALTALVLLGFVIAGLVAWALDAKIRYETRIGYTTGPDHTSGRRPNPPRSTPPEPPFDGGEQIPA